MPAFPAETPPEGWLVTITLSNDLVLDAYWADSQWWAGVNDNPHDVPIDNGHVVSWELIA